MTKTNFVVLFAVALLCCVYGHTTNCSDATRAAIQYRDFLKTTLSLRLKERAERDFIKVAMEYFGVSLYDDAEIEQIMCSVMSSESKTIPDIVQRSQVFSDERQLAFAYTSLVDYYLPDAINAYSRVAENYREQLKFYDRTGFPEFPLNVSSEELSTVVYNLSDYTLSRQFNLYNVRDVFHREEFLAALNNASSLEDFIKACMIWRNMGMTGTGWDSYEKYYLNPVAKRRAQQKIEAVSELRQSLKENEENLKQTMEFYDVLDRSGFLNVTRGGPALYTCDFMADTAAKALGYAVELYGAEAVHSILARHFWLDIDFSLDDEPAFRSWFCAIISSKSQADVMKFVSVEIARVRDVSMYYPKITHYIQLGLARPVLAISKMRDIQMTKIAERVNFPSFPLVISDAQAMQVAAQLISWNNCQHCNITDIENMAQLLREAESRDVVYQDDSLWRLSDRVGEYAGKTDTAVLLGASLYELAMGAEELGLFMLPPN